MIDVHNDWRLGANNDLEFVTGSSAASQRLLIRMGTQVEEWSYDTTVGMSWLYSILGQRGDSAATRQLIVDQIRRDPEVASVGELQASFNNTTRKMNYMVSVRLVDGVNAQVTV